MSSGQLVTFTHCALDFAHSWLHLTECTGQFSQAGPVHGTGTPLVPLVTRFFSHHPSLTVDVWFDMLVATLWRPGLTFRFPGIPGPTRRALDRNGF